eukprot:62367_1
MSVLTIAFKACVMFALLINSGYSATAICGTKTYFTSSYKCCDGVLTLGSPYSKACCRTTAYFTSSYKCCDGVLTPTWPNNKACCGTKAYVTSSYVCCDGVLNPKLSYDEVCCGTKSYSYSIVFDPQSSLYQENAPTYSSSITYICCGGVAMSPGQHCCNGVLC